jgi:Cof subfamily protein (haloacid dehalogenase superfamily)
LGKFSGVLLATDYDETLYGSNLGISLENRAAIEYFISEGGHFTVSTGRSYRNFAIQMKRESLPINTPAILSNGANIFDFQKEKMLYESLIRPEVIQDLANVCTLFPSLGFEAYCREEVYVHNPNAVTERHLSRAGLTGTCIPILDMPVPWTKAILQHEDHALLLEVQKYLSHHWKEHYEVIFSNAVLLELTAKGSHKGSAVLWLADYLGVLRQHIYCIGNGQNDIPMLEVSAVAFASCIARLIEKLDYRYSKIETA